MLDDPLIQSAVAPLAASLIATLALRLAAGARTGPLVAGAGIAVGFLAAYVLIFGPPPLTPRGSEQKVAWLVAVATLGGLGLALAGARPTLERVALTTAAVAGPVWLGWRGLAGGDLSVAITVAACVAGGLAVLWALAAAREAPAGGAAMVVVAAAAGAAVSVAGSSASVGQQLGALAAAAGGFALANWPRPRDALALPAAIAGGGTFAWLLAVLALFSAASPWALALLVPCFGAWLVARRLPLPPGRAGEALRPMLAALLAAVPAAASVWVAQAAASARGAYY